MQISLIILYINDLAWILPPFRQKGTKYFIYFFLLAFSDPILFIINLVQSVESRPYYTIIGTLVLISLLRKKPYYLLLLLSIISIIFLNDEGLKIINFFIHFATLLYFLKDFLLSTSQKSKLVIFNLILVMYEASIMMKFAASYFFTVGYLYYYLTTAFEILIAVFFTIYNEKNSPVIKLQMEPSQTENL